MERVRRRRRRRGRDFDTSLSLFDSQSKSNSSLSTVANSLCSILIFAGLISVVYLMLEYHCTVCPSKCQLRNITDSLQDISINIEKINSNYQDLEKKVIRFAEELPKLQYDINFLESLADAVQNNKYYHNNKSKTNAPQVEIVTMNVTEARPSFLDEKDSQLKKNKTKRVIINA